MENIQQQIEIEAIGAPDPSIHNHNAAKTKCFLLKNFFSFEQQVELFQYIQDRDKTPWDSLPKVMVPTPTTLLLGEEQPSLGFQFGEQTVVNKMVEAARETIVKQQKNENDDILTDPALPPYKSLSFATIRYQAPDGKFPPHIDHCNKNSYVFLMSIGCTANFLVKTPEMADAANNHLFTEEERKFGKRFKMHSGDMLVFDASSEAAVLHGVMGIDESNYAPIHAENEGTHEEKGDDRTVLERLIQRYPVLQNHRFGIQCRMYFD